MSSATRAQDAPHTTLLPAPPDLTGYSKELEAMRREVSALALSHMADTSAWVQSSWAVTEAEGALRRAASTWRAGSAEAAAVATAVQSARAALRELRSLGQVRPR